MSKLVTANLLATGTVVFLGADGRWVETIDAAAEFADDAAAATGLEQAQRDQDAAMIVEPFVAARTLGKDGKPGMTLRDTIRAYRPTVRFTAPAVPGS